MNWVAITGMGIVSSIGNDISSVLSSLKSQTSGIVFSEELKELNLRSQVIGNIDINVGQYLTKKNNAGFFYLSPFFVLLSYNKLLRWHN